MKEGSATARIDLLVSTVDAASDDSVVGSSLAMVESSMAVVGSAEDGPAALGTWSSSFKETSVSNLSFLPSGIVASASSAVRFLGIPQYS